MKTRSYRLKTLAMLLVLALFPLVATAQGLFSTGEDSAANAVERVASTDEMEVVTVTGVFNKDEDKLILNTDDGSYLLSTPVDEALIGQKVIATGVVMAENDIKMFKPQSIKVAQ